MNQNLNDPAFVTKLFDEMAQTYGIVNLIASFGFAARWRRQCVQAIRIEPEWRVLDLMTGMGELIPQLDKQLGPEGRIIALDLSVEMCKRARSQVERCRCSAEVIEENALSNSLQTSSMDAVVCSFGLKTFSHQQIRDLAQEVERVLKPGGCFSFVEISVPRALGLRFFYMFYLRLIVPIIGRLLLGNPENYRLLGIYTANFENCDSAQRVFMESGLITRKLSYFFGCATGLQGHKPRKPIATQAGVRTSH